MEEKMKSNQTSIVTIIWKINKWPRGVRNKIEMTIQMTLLKTL